MSFWQKKKARAEAVASDVDEARRVREEIVSERQSILGKVKFLQHRSEENGFGDELEITFTPKERHAA